jgi:dCMP deaminase
MKNPHKLFADVALRFAQESHCVSKHVAAVAVSDNRIICTGINGTPKGTQNCDNFWLDTYVREPRALSFSDWIKTDEWRQLHMEWSTKNEIHAEQNMIAQAARNGISLQNCDIYVTLSPCVNCSKLLCALQPNAVYYVNQYDKAGGEVEELFRLSGIKLEQVYAT